MLYMNSLHCEHFIVFNFFFLNVYSKSASRKSHQENCSTCFNSLKINIALTKLLFYSTDTKLY